MTETAKGRSRIASRKPTLARSAPRAFLFAALLLTLAGTSYADATGKVHGKVVGLDKLIPDVYAEAADAKNHRYNWREASPTVPAAARALFANPTREVVIAAFGTGASAPLPPIKVLVTGGRTNPTTLVVTPGTHIQFLNVDPFPHQLYEPNNAAFAPTETGHGSPRDYMAPAGAGRHEIRDQLFPSIRTFIVVEAQVVAYAVPSRSGEFTIDGLAGGDYVLRAYFNGKVAGKDSPGAHLGDKGGTFELKDPWNLAGDAK